MDFLEETYEKLKKAFIETNCMTLVILIPTTFVFILRYGSIGSDIDNYHFESAGVIDYIHSNLDAPLIMNLSYVENNCPPQTQILTLGMWPGTLSYDEDTISYDPIPIRFWRDKKFCVRYLTNYTNTRDSCSVGYRKCHRYFCIPDHEPCPISEIKTSFYSSIDDDVDGEIQIANRVYRIARNTDVMPLTRIRMSYYGDPCYAMNRLNDKINPAYDNLNAKMGCGTYGSIANTQVLDQVTEEELYQFNGLIRFMKQISGYLETISGEEVYLVTEHKIQLNDSPYCFGVRSPQQQ